MVCKGLAIPDKESPKYITHCINALKHENLSEGFQCFKVLTSSI